MRTFFLLTFIVVAQISMGQPVSVEYINIITTSANYTFIGIEYQPDYSNTYSPDWDFLQNVYQVKQAQYDRGHEICSREYNKLMSLKLVNLENQKVLQNYQNQVASWASVNFKKYDFSLQENVNTVVNYFTGIYKIKSIRDELNLLKQLNDFNLFVLTADPLKYNKGNMYEQLNSILDGMKYWDGDKLALGLPELRQEVQTANYEKFKKEVTDRFYQVQRTTKVQDGWHYAYMLAADSKSHGRRSVYVVSGRVTIYKTFSGEERNIVAGGDISNHYCKSAIYRAMDANGIFRDMGVELFFID